jgi:hypothetical protein
MKRIATTGNTEVAILLLKACSYNACFFMKVAMHLVLYFGNMKNCLNALYRGKM